MSNKNIILILIAILLFLMLLCIYSSVYRIKETRRVFGAAIRVQGKLDRFVEIEQSGHSSSDVWGKQTSSSVVSSFAVYQYEYEGKSYSAVSGGETDPKDHQIGEIRILYVDPANHSRVLQDTFQSKWQNAFIEAMVALFLAACATALIVVVLKKSYAPG